MAAQLSSILLVCLFLAASVTGHEGHDHTALLPTIFEGHGVVPDVLDAAPLSELKVKFDSGVAAFFGEELTPTQVKNAPTVEWKAEPESFYTIIMTDPDAPSRKNPESREWLHWNVVNIPGTNVTAGDTLAEYVGAGPPEGTGLHRYVVLVFKQQHKHDFGEPVRTKSNANRGKFSTRKFVEKHGLGVAVSGNLFQAQFDDYVPILHKQFQ